MVTVVILIVGVIIASLTTFFRPQIVSRLTDDGLVARRFDVVLLWCGVLMVVSMLEYGNELFFQNVTCAYNDKQNILENVSFKVKKGEKIAIVGGKGEGKTTLIYLMLGIITPVSGDIYMDGKSIRDIGLKKWREHFALIGQKPYLFQGTIKSNIDLYDHMTIEQIKSFAQKCGLDMKMESRTEGYDYRITDNGTNLSGGEKQKIAFLRAIMKNAEIIILDEALSNCDEKSRKIIRQIVMDETFDKTVILVSHYKEDLDDVQRVYEIKGGKVSG